jgi:hypothetical protein
VQINQLQAVDCNLWTMPCIQGSPIVDLANPPPPRR